MKNIKFTEKIKINCSQATAFEYTQDYGQRLNWDTFLIKADLIEGATFAKVGVKALCMAHNGLEMITEYVTFKKPTVTAIKMTKGPYLFKSFLGSWNFKQLELNVTEVLFLYSFQLRFPFNLANNLIKNKLAKNVRQRLLDLKTNIEKQGLKP